MLASRKAKPVSLVPLVLSRVSRLTSAATTTTVAAVLHRCRLLAADAADVRLPRLVDPLLRPASSRRRRPWWLVCECVRERVCVCVKRAATVSSLPSVPPAASVGISLLSR